MFGLKVRTLYHIYKEQEYLSACRTDIKEKIWCKEKIEVVHKNTGEIAMPVETATAEGVESAMETFGGCLHKIKNVSMDMSPTYALVFNSLVPRAVQVADRFHVME
jgi:transposase